MNARSLLRLGKDENENRKAVRGISEEDRPFRPPVAHKCPHKLWIRKDAEVHLAAAWTIEFTEEDALPSSKSEASVLYGKRRGNANENGLHMGISVAFGVCIAGVAGDEAVERGFDVTGHVGISVFIDGDPGGGVRDVEIAEARGDGGGGDGLGYLSSDFDELGAA
jgi:hypothetical protein